MFYETHFKETIAEGAKFSPYIHRADVTQDDLTTAASRRFFWYLWKYDLDQFTLWCTTLWSQPSKMGETRAAKRTWPVENGLMIMKRNHGISDGCMFYPGGDGLVGSILAACWRDGIEDYEYLKILSGLVENADPSDPAVKATASPKRSSQCSDFPTLGMRLSPLWGEFPARLPVVVKLSISFSNAWNKN